MKKILIADKDESLKDAFRVVFPSDEYEILFTSNGREVEKIVEEYRPEIYILNTSLEKKDGVDVYKDLKERNMLKDARFFFMKDEGMTTEFNDYPIEGVIEKPINFFRVHQMIDKEDVLPDLKFTSTRKMEEKTNEEIEPYSPLPFSPLPREKTTVLENELRMIFYDAIESLKMSIVDRITPVISLYIEEHAKKILNDTAEKVIRGEMERLLSALREPRK